MSEQAGASRILAARPIDAAGGGELFWQRLKRDRVAVGAALFIALVFVACFALEPLFEHLLGHGPDDIFPFAVDQLTLKPADLWSHVPASPTGTGPRTLFVLGADGPLGRDEFLRLLAGGQASLEVAVGATVLAVTIGTVLGAIAGYLGGRVDTAISRLTDFVMGFPILLLVVAFGLTISPRLNTVTVGGVFVPGVLTLVSVIGLFAWFYLARIVRAQVLEHLGASSPPSSARRPATRSASIGRSTSSTRSSSGGSSVPRASARRGPASRSTTRSGRRSA